MTTPTISDQPPTWATCQHHWDLCYGPVIKCSYCGAQTMVSMDGKSKPIYPPAEIKDVMQQILMEDKT